MPADRGPRRWARSIVAPAERRLAVVVGRLITDKVAHYGLDRVAPAISQLEQRLSHVEASLGELGAWAHRTELASRDGADADQRSVRELERIVSVLQLLYDEEPENRRRLWQLRARASYENAFTDPDPLVSVVIPTHTNFHALRERALPSALAQTHAKLEIVVVGDQAPAETADVIAELDDGRIRYHNLERRGPYPDDLHKLWLVGGTPPYNTAVRLARGSWIAYLSDDDSFRADHLERLLNRARADRLELCYGLLVEHDREGRRREIGAFPPGPGQFGFQAAIYHAGLADFLEFELADAEFDQAVDWGLCRRMLRAGVRMGMVAEPTTDYFPSWEWAGRKERHERERAMSDGSV
jgi:Glycosyl transferase family 2